VSTKQAAVAPPPATAVTIAESRRGAQLRKLRNDLEKAERISAPINPGCPPSEYARQAAQRELGLADLRARIEATDAMTGWELVNAYKGNESGTYRY
jgi:hypothetical protein